MAEINRLSVEDRPAPHRLLARDVVVAASITILAVVLTVFAWYGTEPQNPQPAAGRSPAVGVSADVDLR